MKLALKLMPLLLLTGNRGQRGAGVGLLWEDEEYILSDFTEGRHTEEQRAPVTAMVLLTGYCLNRNACRISQLYMSIMASHNH
ncbi:hypothetical protein E2C01_028654 [Portunus trituberculatus]|uniref:Secreted protein n=1 Tax=Portunus trituberculatus TaxID=210409 RepID=A0A5B7EPN8_PORTR|nr:hypothetical protein [Portunus trituberculatus]